jgi:hypothetical protein
MHRFFVLKNIVVLLAVLSITAAPAWCRQQSGSPAPSQAAAATSVREQTQESARMRELRKIILHSQHLGAHGMGYNSASLEEMSRKLKPGDVADLLTLMQPRESGESRVGAQFGLASQCAASFAPLREAMNNHQVMFFDAQDTARLPADFARCSPADRAKATAMVSELEELFQADMARSREENEKKAAEDQRIQANGLKLMDPAKAKTLTRTEREEVFARSVKAAGLDKEPLTDAQKKMVQQMYRTMVLGESGNRPAN